MTELRGGRLLQVAFPLGGIGAGSISLNGQGGLQDFAIRHAPATSAFPEANEPRDAAFALLRADATGDTRLVEGPLPPEKVYAFGLKGQGFLGGGFEGLPRFGECSFRGDFPFASVELSDPRFPFAVSLRAWSPFVPLDDEVSSMPCAILEYRLANRSVTVQDYRFSYHLSHLAHKLLEKGSRSEVLPGRGVFFSNADPELGSAAFALLGPTSGDALADTPDGHRRGAAVKGRWFRGEWFDAVSRLWDEVSAGGFTPVEGADFGDFGLRIGGSAELRGRLEPGGAATHAVAIAWHFPALPPLDDPYRAAFGVWGQGARLPRGPLARDDSGLARRPWYATRWPDARAVLDRVTRDYDSLRARTESFGAALSATSLPPEALEEVKANLSILRSPTILREASGGLWAWEGCFSEAGCCSGSCTHVWNYAQAIPHLFPNLERSLRELELVRSMDERGHVQFRAPYGDSAASHDYHAAADGQFGGVMKLHREWLVSGDRDWLARMYPLARRAMEYAIAAWDPRGRGLPDEPHHNTYDIEFWGPEPLGALFYVGALAAMAAMARALGRGTEAADWTARAEAASRAVDGELWNGEYYSQKVEWLDRAGGQFERELAARAGETSEESELLRAEGPKYQYGSGCLSDGVFGAWLAELCGVDAPLDRARIRSHLAAVHRHNFRRSLRGHIVTQRPGYALPEEGGLLLCSWPRGGRPSLPFVYADEVWTGVEYQVASHLVREGLVEEGLEIVRTLRARYDGRIRNPFAEYECGYFYARALASYALLYAHSGLAYSAPDRRLGIGPARGGGTAAPASAAAGEASEYRAFLSAATGWGTVTLGPDFLVVELVEGSLAIDSIEVSAARGVIRGEPRVLCRQGRPLRIEFAKGGGHVA